MKINPVAAPSLDGLATETIRLRRELHEMAHAVYVGGNIRDFGFAARTLGRLAERQPFDSRDTASFQALRGIIDTDLSREVVGTERRFVETRYDNDGQHGEVREIPVYSARGETLLRLQETLNSFLAARDAALDRIAADRALMQLLRT
ncbi:MULTISPECIES: hypothetical protein [unclassified Paracoccus (in: a-proteobacteria)]|uniref:hypothetical protein n=1 Tax=unclassified Paracoccus (in: a-proteobacteria) TaxID=2688777 RepID=UPI0016047926|nr:MULTISPECIES: hypothetical protein [unclassified Paracoccus (in: a-proteobacteria)]MBB1492863.1 hypothetical protein [Paracoccus sp. MC1854]MBB1499279.1 hypothetical protein [Paracoccus sp. MC1862]QQO45823.1 hypothetical protein JGR78_05815 [Paracoccus sp. MC1862]